MEILLVWYFIFSNYQQLPKIPEKYLKIFKILILSLKFLSEISKLIREYHFKSFSVKQITINRNRRV